MGKVLSAFGNGFPGSVTRSMDDVIISMKNAGDAAIPFGAPVFLSADRSGVVGFDPTSPQEFTDFVGFAVRSADKTPGTYPGGPFDAQPQGEWEAGSVMEVLVRGSIAIKMSGTTRPGGRVYLRKSDGVITASAGSEGTTIELTNARVRRARLETNGCAELTVLNRNIQ